MKALAVVLTLAASLALAGCGSTDESPEAVEETTAEQAEEPESEDRPGLARVYAEIEVANCASLQETFDRNMDRYEMRDATERQQPGSFGEVEFAYAQAAQEQIEARC